MYVLLFGKDALVIDPCVEPAEIEEKDLSIKAVLLTHGHFDHISEADAFVKKFACPVYVSAEDSEMLPSSEKNHSSYFGMNVKVDSVTTVYNKESYDQCDFGIQEPFTLQIFKTPGHTSGSVCLLFTFENDGPRKYMFTGDTLFSLSIGRTDLGGSDRDMRRSLDMLSDMDEDIICFPGHGEKTSIGREKKYNPYMNM